MTVEWVVVGAGFTGATFAERMAAAGKRVAVVERRSHIGGNAYDSKNEHGILVHRYGPHIFHTNSKVVWEYLSKFTAWRPYEHRVLGLIDGKFVPIPFNLNSLAALFPASAAARKCLGWAVWFRQQSANSKIAPIRERGNSKNRRLRLSQRV